MKISRSIAQELEEAGHMQVPISWSPETGTIEFPDGMSKAERDAIQSVFDAHNPLTGLKTEATALLNSAAENARLKWVTTGSAKSMEYQQKASEARAIFASSNLQLADYPFAAKNSVSTGRTLVQVATEWDAKAKAWAQIGATIADLTETAATAIKALSNSATFEDDAQAIIDAIVWP